QLREAQEILKSAATAILQVTSLLDARFCDAVELLGSCHGTVVVCGMGKAGLIGRKLTATLSSTGTRAQFLHPAEAVHGDLGSLREGDVLLVLSNSGETEEICRLIPMVRRLGVAMVAITSRAGSTLGTQADVVLETGPVHEAGHFGLAPTTSTTVMLALGDALALVVSRCRGFSREQFALLHPAGALGRRLTGVQDVMRSGE
ncbi:MAG: SIS domain-containing protein, partial [Planctomycetaceae bacterium]